MRHSRIYTDTFPIFISLLLVPFQYLELRYNSKLVRVLASLSYIVSMILYMGVVLYAPCLALKTVTGMPVIGIILMAGTVGTIYTVMVM